ncbi:MAG: chromate transporter [Cyanobacteriota bacterium]|nr:chromate transporter [Cyanobacteriota bacterium]
MTEPLLSQESQPFGELQAPAPTLPQLFVALLQVALSSFGGGLSVWSQRILVEQRRWLSNDAFLTGLTVARLLPGPNQINLAVYVGATFRGLPGALTALAGMLLVPFSLLMGIGLLYFHLHGLPLVDRVLAGLVAVAAGLALSMGFKILPSYRADPVALLLAAGVFLAMEVLKVRLVPLLLVVSPLAILWYWPRQGTEGGS